MVMLTKSELKAALELDSEMRLSLPGQVYNPKTGLYEKLKNLGLSVKPFEERIDEKGHVTYHRSKK